MEYLKIMVCPTDPNTKELNLGQSIELWPGED